MFGLFTLKRGFVTRCLAVALVGYSALASARGLVPSICATLSSLPEAQGAHCKEPVSCCAAKAGSGGAAVSVPQHDCAFCLIVHTPVQPVCFDAPLPPAPVAAALPLYAAHHFQDPFVSGANLCRAPPLS